MRRQQGERNGDGAEVSTPRLGLESLLASILAGVVVGVLAVVFTLSFAAIIFSGDLAPYLERGIGLALLAAVALTFLTALFASYPATIAIPQDVTAIVLSLATVSLAQELSSGETLYATVVALIAITTLATATVFLGLGFFRGGDLIRYLPLPVLGGFLAATGWLLVKGSVSLMMGAPLTFSSIADFLRPEALTRWLPGLVLGVVLLALTRRFPHWSVLPLCLLIALAGFYGMLWFGGWPPSEASQTGWMLGPFEGAGFWSPLGPTMLVGADWSAVLAQAPTVVTVVLIAVIGFLLETSGIELTTRRDIALNHDLRVAGAANALAALGGGFVGYHFLGLSLLGNRMGAERRLVGVVAALCCLLALIAGAPLLAVLPKVVLGAVIAYLGFELMLTWLIVERKRLPPQDFAVVLLLFLVSAAVGFLEGIGVGLLVAVAIFVINYSQVDVVRHELPGHLHHGKVERAESHAQILRERGDEILIVELQAFIFFGTAHRLLRRLRTRLNQRDRPLRFVVLDFAHVHGLDSSAVLSFVKLQQRVRERHGSLVLTGLSAGARQQMQRGGVGLGGKDGALSFEHLDLGVEWCEEQIIAAANLAPDHREAPLGEALRRAFGAETSQLLRYFERRRFAPGELLMRQGEPAANLYFIEAGRVVLRLERPSGASLKLRSMGPGVIVGEVGLYLESTRTASVVAESACTAQQISREALGLMARENPHLVAHFHRFVAHNLARRLADTTKVLDAVLR